MINTPNVFNPEMAVEQLESFVGPINKDDTPTHDRQGLSFDDFEPWQMVNYLGRETMITAMGYKISDEDGRHMVLDAMDREQPQRIILHESWVNNWLNARMVISPMITTTERLGVNS